jgi:Rhodanese-like domain
VRHNRNEFGALEPGETATAMEDRLRFHTDSWHLSVDLKAGPAAIVVIDARSRDAYIAGHIPGAVDFPHREMNSETIGCAPKVRFARDSLVEGDEFELMVPGLRDRQTLMGDGTAVVKTAADLSGNRKTLWGGRRGMATSSLHFLDGVPRCPSRMT